MEGWREGEKRWINGREGTHTLTVLGRTRIATCGPFVSRSMGGRKGRMGEWKDWNGRIGMEGWE